MSLLFNPIRKVFTKWPRLFFTIYHKINKNTYNCILYDELSLWQKIQWGLNFPENWSKKCKQLANK